MQRHSGVSESTDGPFRCNKHYWLQGSSLIGCASVTAELSKFVSLTDVIDWCPICGRRFRCMSVAMHRYADLVCLSCSFHLACDLNCAGRRHRHRNEIRRRLSCVYILITPEVQLTAENVRSLLFIIVTLFGRPGSDGTSGADRFHWA